MKKLHLLDRDPQAFTLTELLAVMTIVALLALLAIPALARTKTKSTGVGCLSNMRQMMVAWAMYKEDNNDFIVPNTLTRGWLSNVPNQDWYNSPGNTNTSPYASSILGTYLGGDVRPFSCPADNLPSANGFRIRSRSMNGQMGLLSSSQNNNPAYKWYSKGSDFTCPQPASTFIFADESFWTMNDGILLMGLQTFDFPDAPAAYHAGGCGFSFADGHGEIHKWRGAFNADSVNPVGLQGVVYSYGVIRTSTQHVIAANGSADVDWIWLSQHAACTAGQ